MTLWAKGLDFKNKANSTRVGGVGVYGQDGQAQKVYLGLGHEPWNNQGLEMTSSTIKFKGNDIYHVGRKPSPAEIGAKPNEPTTFHVSDNYVGVRTSVRKPNQYYEFWDTNAGWADIKCRNIYAGDGQYLVYHKGFKPSPAEIGALPSNGTAIASRKVGQTYVSVPCYNFENGVLIDTGVIAGQSTMFSVIIKGNGYSAVQPINCSYCFYDYTQNEGIIQTSGVSLCGAINLKVFRYQGKVYLWAKQTSNYQTLIFEITLGNRSDLDPNKITLQNAAMPTSGVSNLREIVPIKAYTPFNKPSPAEIGAVNKSGDTINGNLTIANNGVLNAGNISLRGRDITINGKRALVGYSQDDGNLLIINFDKDYGAGVVIKGNVHVQQGALKADNGLDAKLNSIEIPAGHNLNDYQTPGMYYCPSDANASKIGNVPVGCAFSLLVEAHAGRKQTFTCYWKDNPKTYVRNFYMGQWGAWLIQCDGLTGPNGVSWVDKTNYWNKVPFVGSDGVMEVGKYIDFHNSDRDSKDFQVRLEAGTDGKLYCYPGFVGDDFYANKYIRIRDWYGAATDGKIYFKNDGRIMATEDVSTFQCNKFKALEGGITSDGQIYAYRNDVVADRNLIFGGRAISTLQSGESNLFAEGRQSAHGYGWHFANLNGQYSDIYAKIYHQQSDARTKIEIPKTLSLPENNESVLNKISKVTPKEFYYSEDKNKKIIYGFFAQELESQFPLAVNTSQYSKEDIESGNIIFPKDKNGEDIHDLKSIDPVAISAIMWDALKEVNVALEMQRIKNKELLDRIKVLEEKNK